MLELGFQMNPKSPRKFIFPSLISCVFVLISQFSLVMIPCYFPSYSLLAKLALSGFLLLVIAGSGRSCRRILRVYASAPASVFFNILFIWGVPITVIGKAVPPLTSIVFNAECALLMVGLYRYDVSLVSMALLAVFFLVILAGLWMGFLVWTGLFKNAISNVNPHSRVVKEEELSTTGLCVEQHIVKMERVTYCKSCKA